MKGVLLVLDTSTRTPVVALAGEDGTLITERRWESHHRHGEELLERIDEVLASQSTDRRALGGVIVGTGPGSFTGLRIGLATSKTIAYALGIPIVGVSSTLALALAAASSDPGLTEMAVTLPAGASDRYVHRLHVAHGTALEIEPPRLAAATHDVGEPLIAVDLDAADLPDEAKARGQRAIGGLALALATLGSRQLADGRTDDPAELVPAYVALPRGIAAAVAEMAWSPDLR